MLTYSGLIITRDAGVPSLEDISIHLSRINRWGGAIGPWPVLLHSMLVAELVSEDAKGYALLHDCAEAVVGGNIPFPFKTSEQKLLEEKIRERMFSHWNIPESSGKIREEVHLADRRARNAEARYFNLKDWDQVIIDPFGVDKVKLLWETYTPVYSAISHFMEDVKKQFPDATFEGVSAQME